MAQGIIVQKIRMLDMLTVDIDGNSGFCAGVISAIGKAEEFLNAEQKGKRRLYSLGSIVHNDAELSRLMDKGLVTIDKEDLHEMVDAAGETLLIRAHGEPPQTYKLAENLGFEVIDCTCPVVLRLQRSIKDAYKAYGADGQIIIFGKPGHAEVLGLMGQTDESAIVVENLNMLETALSDGTIKPELHTEVFSQTTKSPSEYAELCARLEEVIQDLNVHDTICRQVATRHQKLEKFAVEHDIIIFVSGKASSNGKVLCDLCKSVNIRTYHIDSPDEIKRAWFRPDDCVGVCGATSTPKWLLEQTAASVLELNNLIAAD